MARIRNSPTEKVFSIKKWLGVNECPDGDTNLKMGEAAVMRNFKITKDDSLQLRPGSRNVAGLLAQYTISVDDEATTVATDLNSVKSAFAARPSIAVSDGGILSLSGESVTINASNISTYEGYYYQDNNDIIYQIGEIEEVIPAGGVAVTGGKVTIASNETVLLQTEDYGTSIPPPNPISGYDSVKVVSGTVQTDGTLVTAAGTNAYGNYYVKDGAIYQISRYYGEIWSSMYGTMWQITYLGKKVTFHADNQYKWNFFVVSATTASTDKAVRGIWSGYVGGTEYIVAAANGNLWSLTEEDGVWTKSNIGAIDTENPVHFFGYDENLYMLNGKDYKVWDGETFKSVVGYRPLVSISTTPAGGGTALEQVNKLNGLRRAWFSPDGDATVFQLPETGISSVDYVKYRANDTEIDFTANTATGEVTVTGSAPANGTNTIEIGWTVSDTDKSTVTGMMFSEIYSGASDSRVFLYGDGSNMAIYSGLDYDGKPTAEYFPDLNVIHVGESNTPITGLLRHFDRLMAFKQDSAYSISYDTITLVDGTVTAGFYVQTINKGLGNTALGQAQLVENYPRTLDGRSVYEWRLQYGYSNDQKNAKRISQRVETTLKSLDLTTAVTYYDKINHEYYILQDSKMLVNNTELDVWYIYDGLPATCMIVYKDEVYFGDTDGYIRHFSRDYMNDNGANIVAHWESGSMDFGASYMRKYSAMLWMGLKPEARSSVNVTVETDRQKENSISEAATGLFSFSDLDFSRLSFNVNDKPRMDKFKIKVKNFHYYTLVFNSDSNNSTVTINNAVIRVRYTGYVK